MHYFAPGPLVQCGYAPARISSQRSPDLHRRHPSATIYRPKRPTCLAMAPCFPAATGPVEARATPYHVWQHLRLIRQMGPANRGNVHPDHQCNGVPIRTSPSQCTGLVRLDTNGTDENGQYGSKIHQRRLGNNPVTGLGEDQRGHQPQHPSVTS